jgi:hypothetical protein
MRAGSADMGWTESLEKARNVPQGHINGVWVLGWRPFCCPWKKGSFLKTAAPARPGGGGRGSGPQGGLQWRAGRSPGIPREAALRESLSPSIPRSLRFGRAGRPAFLGRCASGERVARHS